MTAETSPWTDEQFDRMVDQIRDGRALPLEQRQARWDRIQGWSVIASLAQMVELEAEASGVTLSRERIRAIRDGARPGSVPRPQLPGLLGRQARAKAKLKVWRSKKATGWSGADAHVDRLVAELAEIRSLITAEQRRLKGLGKFPDGKVQP